MGEDRNLKLETRLLKHIFVTYFLYKVRLPFVRLIQVKDWEFIVLRGDKSMNEMSLYFRVALFFGPIIPPKK